MTKKNHPKGSSLLSSIEIHRSRSTYLAVQLLKDNDVEVVCKDSRDVVSVTSLEDILNNYSSVVLCRALADNSVVWVEYNKTESKRK